MSPTIVGEHTDSWCIDELCGKMGIGCDVDTIDVVSTAIALGAPKDLAEEIFTKWGVLALRLDVHPKKAIGFRECPEVLALYLFEESKETKNINLALKFNSSTQIEALKLSKESDINLNIALNITDTEQLNEFTEVVSNPNFGLIQQEALNTNKLSNPEDALRFSSFPQVEALKFENITIEQALTIDTDLKYQALMIGAPYEYAVQCEHNTQLEAFKRQIPPEYALKFNASRIEYFDNLDLFSDTELPLRTLVALYITSKGMNRLQNITTSCSAHQETSTTHSYTLNCSDISNTSASYTIEFPLQPQKEAFLLGISNILLTMKFEKAPQVNALRAGVEAEKALKFNTEIQVKCIELGVPYPEALKCNDINVLALKTGKILNATDALKFDDRIQIRALEIKGINFTQALNVSSTIVLEALTIGVSYDYAKSFTNDYQLEAIKLQIPPNLAIKFTASYQIKALDFGASYKEASEINWFGMQYLKYNYVIDYIPFAVGPIFVIKIGYTLIKNKLQWI